MHFHLVRELTQLNEGHSINSNKRVNSTDGGREENENDTAHFTQPDCQTIPSATVRKNDFTEYILTGLHIRLFINRFHITLNQITGCFFYSSQSIPRY